MLTSQSRAGLARGQAGTIFEGGTFKLDITFPTDYPFKVRSAAPLLSRPCGLAGLR
jgi:hypothetical protein